MIYKGVTGDIHSRGIHLSDGVRLVYSLHTMDRQKYLWMWMAEASEKNGRMQDNECLSKKKWLDLVDDYN